LSSKTAAQNLGFWRVLTESVALIRGFDENREKQKGDAQNEHTENDRPCELE
jgi:hypothetical protein